MTDPVVTAEAVMRRGELLLVEVRQAWIVLAAAPESPVKAAAAGVGIQLP